VLRRLIPVYLRAFRGSPSCGLVTRARGPRGQVRSRRSATVATLASASAIRFPVDASKAALGRLDVAAELQFEEGTDGLAFPSRAVVGGRALGEGRNRGQEARVHPDRELPVGAWSDDPDAGLRQRHRVRSSVARRTDPLRASASVSRARRAVRLGALDLDIGRLFVGRELASLLDVTAEVVCDQWGAIDRLNGLVRSVGSNKAPRADALASFLVLRRDGTSSRPGTAGGLRYATSAS